MPPSFSDVLRNGQARREDLVQRMAADLVRFDSARNEQDAIRSLFGNGHSMVDIVMLVDEARQAALAEISRREQTPEVA